MILYPYNYIFKKKYITLKTMYTKNYTTCYNVAYKNKPIYIQTPKLEILKLIFKEYIDIVLFQTSSSDAKVIQFLESIRNLYQISKTNSKIKSMYNEQYLYGELHKMNNQSLYAIYDSNKNVSSIEKLKNHYESINIIKLDNIWIKRNRMGIHWKIVQMKYFIPIYMRECIIHDISDVIKESAEEISESKQQNRTTFKNHPKYARFFKMLSMGIPKPSIIQKCILENIDPKCLEHAPDDIVPDRFNDKVAPKPIFTASDLIGCKLKKTVIVPKKKIRSKNVGFIPDITQLLKIRNSLNKVNRDHNIY